MGRSRCCEKAHSKRGAWSQDEDDKLISHIQAHGAGCWKSVPKAVCSQGSRFYQMFLHAYDISFEGLRRRVKSCRLRWVNYLKPDLKRGNFSVEEDELIIELQLLWGNKCSRIARRLPGRTDNEIKNHWKTHIKRKLLSRGIDPQFRRTIQPFHSDGSSGRDDRSPGQQISMVDFFQIERSIVTSNFDLAASNGANKSKEKSDANLELTLSVQSSASPGNKSQ